MNKKQLDYPIHVRLDAEQLARLETFCTASKMSRSQVIRELLSHATLRPAIIRTEAPVANGQRQRQEPMLK